MIGEVDTERDSHCVTDEVKNIDPIKPIPKGKLRGFDSDGYRFDADESDADRWRFTRA